MSAWLHAQLREAQLRVAELQRQLAEVEPGRAVPMREIVTAVAEVFEIEGRQLLGRQQTSRFTRPRQAAMALMRDVSGRTYAEIGRLLDRDHTTICEGYRVHTRRMAADPEYAARVRAVSERFQRSRDHVAG